MDLLDILFPKRCIGCKKGGEYLCPNCFANMSFEPQMVCAICNRWSMDGKTHALCLERYSLNGTFAAVSYKGIVRKLIYQLKYAPYLTDLLPTLGELCVEALIQKESFMQLLPQKPLFVPIPLSAKRLRQRGYNQAELLAKELGKRFGLEVSLLLKRVKETTPQYGLKREERLENMKGAFGINTCVIANEAKQSKKKIATGQDVDHRHDEQVILLVDDVLTTGSTMLEAAKVLKKNGYKNVWGLALAKD